MTHSHIGLVVYPRFTALDIVGPYEVLSRLPATNGTRYRTIWLAGSQRPVTSDRGLTIVPEAALADAPPLDVIVVPGGPGQLELMNDRPFLIALKRAASSARIVASVCTGSLLLAAAGLLDGKRATTHWMARDALADLGAEPVPERVVRDGDTITGAGVSAGIDLALTLAADLVGEHIAQMIQLGIEYDPQPPYRSGSPETAPPEVVASLRGASREYLM